MTRFLCSLALFVLITAPSVAAAGQSSTPRRDDFGDLIVLHLYGSYYEMGRQQARLLGPAMRRMYDYHVAKFRGEVVKRNSPARLLDWAAWWMTWIGPLYEESGFYEEMNGIADELGVSRADVLRAVAATSFGSTVFAATRGATADGDAIIGRGVDWSDGNGVMRPVVMHVHPSNGDRAYVLAGWPMIGAPAIGINDAGFALSFNFFITDETIGIPPQMRDRRALQTATTVEEGIRAFTGVRKRAMPTFMVMADSGDDIGMVECTPSACAVFRPQPPDADWLAQSNHARTPPMIPLDRYRSPDSFARRAAMEAAVRPHLGRITPAVAADIMRDRSNTPYVNDPCVANLYVLNAAVIQPRTKTLWHATSMQPLAPFGELLPFSVAADPGASEVLAADPRWGSDAMRREAEVIAEARSAVSAYDQGDLSGAQVVWDRQAARAEALLNPDRLAYARAVARLRQGQREQADTLLSSIDLDRAPFEIASTALLLRGILAGERGDAEAERRLFATAARHVERYPEFTDDYTAVVRRHIADGVAGRRVDIDFDRLPDLQYVPR
jgi:hypothetical protein